MNKLIRVKYVFIKVINREKVYMSVTQDKMFMNVVHR